MTWPKILSNLAILIIGIWICFYGAVQEKYLLTLVSVLVLLAAHLLIAKDPIKETSTIILSGMVGAIVESINVGFGIYQYSSAADQAALLPNWIILIWFLIGTTARHAFAKLANRIVLTIIVGVICSSTIYYAGSYIGALQFAVDSMLLIGIAILLWVLAFLVIIFIGNQFFADTK